ncbi:Hpt domain-containing protein [Oleidesulfovibrio sp.]|uniref:Hpt domain-containing protein n=1 Tax=Oleidesulfovibrio sp. TaxID=2909707 RepID=UPI003A8BEB44
MGTRVMALPVFDPDGAASHLGLRREDILELTKMFLQDIPSWRESFAEAAINTEQLRTASHRLKGEAANIGAQALRTAAYNLEQAVLNGFDRVAVEEIRLLLLEELDVFAREAQLITGP